MEYPTEQLRIRAFLQFRFGVSPAAKLTSGIKSIFAAGWPWPEMPRDEFMDYQGVDATLPTQTELDAFASGCVTKLLSVAGL
ncbi:hypothetical protein [Homoserinimonas aerilata]|uniref:hypothetical protein n=1 Tax=Homoserinimonas aerilata TaxID=1162970 RepID=UPI0011507FEC|nr:hypothetical protein [Homoserinimonas aerilata]